jgi:VWFA-related protein
VHCRGLRYSVLLILGACNFVGAQDFKSAVDQVVVPVTILSKPGASQVDLQPSDLRVFDNGKAVPVLTFGKVRQPVHVLLLLDASRSMMQSVSDVRSAAAAVAGHLTHEDAVSVGIFSSSLRLSPAFSASDGQVLSRLPFEPGANMTILYDALANACGAFTGESYRRVMFVVSDGMDTASSASAGDVTHRAAEADVTIYGVGVTSRYVERGQTVTRPPDLVLRTIAEATGGAYLYAGSDRDFSNLFARTIEEIHEQYLLGFTPALADGRVHALQVTTRRPDIGVRARTHYRAPLPRQ